MDARSYFRQLLAICSITALLLGVAVVSPLIVGSLLGLSDQRDVDRGGLVACLIMPTAADWPAHMLSYVLAVVLSLGVALGLASFFRQWYRTRRLVRACLQFSVPVQDLRARKVFGLSPAYRRELARLLTSEAFLGTVDLVDLDDAVAFCYGWLRPRICVSVGALAGLKSGEAEALLLHERYHLLSRDPLKTCIARVLCGSFFFLPAVPVLQRQYMIAREIEADEYALLSQGSERPLLGALYKLLVKQSAIHRASGLAVAQAVEAINVRLDYLLDHKKPAGPSFLALFLTSSIVVLIVATMTFTTWNAAGNALWHQAHLGVGGC